MATTTETKSRISAKTKAQMGEFFGRMFAFNTSLKLYHWRVSGKGSYAEHIALDQALESLGDVLDRIVETSYAFYGTLDIIIPETETPRNIAEHAESFYKMIDGHRAMFSESFTAAILDDFQETIQQLLYRLKRLE